MSNKDIKKHFEEALQVLNTFNTDANIQKIEDGIEILSTISFGEYIEAIK